MATVTPNPTRTESYVGDSTSKSQKLTNEVVPVDRVSNLPDSVLNHILSYLPIKDVVAAGVLSKRWDLLWTNVPNLEFEEKSNQVLKNGVTVTFASIVNRVLLGRNAGSSIRKFRLKCESEIYSMDVGSWITNAISLNVQELDVAFGGVKVRSPLPRSVFTNKMLVVLKLCGGFLINVPSAASIPNLRTLELDSVTYRDGESVCKLISCSLVLENLFVRRTKFDNVEKFLISVPTLKCIKIDFQDFAKNGPHKCVLEIGAQDLEVLDINDYASEHVMVNNVKFLSLSGSTPTELIMELEVESKKFLNLTHLTMGPRCVYYPVLPYFLQFFENLEVLRLTKCEPRGSLENAEDLRMEPEHAPRCLLSSLRAVQIDGFRASEAELCTLKYILKNGMILETVEIRHCDHSYVSLGRSTYYSNERAWEDKYVACHRKFHESDSKFRALQKISKFPRGSKTCEISFS